MQFQVPQFIETEDKIVGPLTFRQFIYIAIGAIISFVLFFVLQVWLWLIVTFILMTISASLAFIKINGRSMSVFAQSTFGYIWSPKVYTLKPKPQEQKIGGVSLRPAPAQASFGGIRSLLDKMTTYKAAIPKREKTVNGADFGISKQEVKQKYEVIRKITGDRELGRRIDYR
ncbi:MAG TPA: PrgI family protein [Candidatus Paceibacterota bacterium]|nr:PrgI family protein [Candidatus Paceibacterota bacterium]